MYAGETYQRPTGYMFDAPLRSWSQQLADQGKPTEADKIPGNLLVTEAAPDLVIRRGLQYTPEDIEAEAQLYSGVTEEFIYLEEEFGIKTPGLSMARRWSVGEQIWTPFLMMKHIEGLNFIDDLPDIPRHVATTACRALFGYNATVLERGRYCTDMRLRQLMWGKEDSGQTEPALYMVDPDPWHSVRPSDPEAQIEWYYATRGVVSGHMISDLNRLRRVYGDPFTVLDQERKAVEAHLAATAVLI
jgi:hypothetical protein